MNPTRPPDTTCQYWLGRDVFCAEVVDGVIFLDLKRNRYLGLPTEHALKLRGLPRRGPIVPVDPAPIAALVESNLFSRTPQPEAVSFAPPVATGAIRKIDLFRARERLSAVSGARFAAAYIRSHAPYRTRSLESAVTHLRRRKVTKIPSLEAGEQKLLDLSVQFMKFRALTYSARNRCLLDCLVLADFLQSHRVSCTFVLGVASRPFRAHCWIQSAGLVLNDTYENVSAFSPLLSV
jgi:hypothetical protein